MPRTGFVAILAAFGIMLGGCLGGGGGTTPTAGGGGMDQPGPMMPSGPTEPVTVSLGDLEISSIHLEMSDLMSTYRSPGTDLSVGEEGVGVTVNQYRRQLMVCPGVPPNGNVCIGKQREIDGETYDIREDYTTETGNKGFVDLSISFHESFLEALLASTWAPLIENEINKFQGYAPPWNFAGGHGKYMLFYLWSTSTSVDDQTASAAFGRLYSDYPKPSDNFGATWSGYMAGVTRANPIHVSGNALLEYDFSQDTLDLTLDEIQGDGYSGPASFAWSDLNQNDDGSFYLEGYGNHRAGTGLHPTLGYVDGDFYGPNAEEFAGVFERGGVVGAFGGHRQPTE